VVQPVLGQWVGASCRERQDSQARGSDLVKNLPGLRIFDLGFCLPLL
jgi:hypothetical protein